MFPADPYSFYYCVDPTADEPIMLLNGPIGYDSATGEGIDGAQFQTELLRLDTMGKSRIQVWINSIGGVVIDGFAIYNAIGKSKTKVDTYNVGIAASIAAVIFQAGRKRYSADYSVLMYHMPHGAESNVLSVFADAISKMIERSGLPKEEIESLLNNGDTFLTAKEALAKGLTDCIEDSSDMNKKRMSTVSTDAQATWKEASKILNQVLPKKNIQMPFLKVTNKLSLNDAATEENIVTAIEGIENALAAEKVLNKKSADEVIKMKADLDAAADAFAKLKEQYDAAVNSLNTSKDAAATEKAKNMVTEFAKIGKIKNDDATIARWTARAKDKFDEIKSELEELPLNKVAPKLEVKNIGENTIVANAAAKMLEIAAKYKQ